MVDYYTVPKYQHAYQVESLNEAANPWCNVTFVALCPLLAHQLTVVYIAEQ